MLTVLAATLLLAQAAPPAEAALEGCQAVQQDDGWMYFCNDRRLWAWLQDDPGDAIADARKQLAIVADNVRYKSRSLKRLIAIPDPVAEQEEKRTAQAERAAVKAALGKAAEIEWFRHVSPTEEFVCLALQPRPEGARTLLCGEGAAGGCAQVLSLLAAQPWRPGVVPGTTILRADH